MNETEKDVLLRFTDSEGVVFHSSKKTTKGGPGSGNFGHEGRPGEVGGSGGGGGSEHETATREEAPKEEAYHTFAAAADAFEKYYKTLPDGTQEYLVDYCDGEYATINTYMRTGGLGVYEGRTDPEYIKDAASSMTQVLDESPKYEGTVYRGTAPSAERYEQIKGLEPGDKMSMAGFTSTSVEREIAREFADTGGRSIIYTIDNAKGSAIGELSGVPGEKEIVLPHGASYEVKGVQEGDMQLSVHLKMV